MDGGIKALKATGMEERTMTTFNGSPLSIRPNPRPHANNDAHMGTSENLIIETAKDVFYAKVVGKVADNNTVTIRMEPGADNVTNLRIKANRFGNEARSRVIYEKIKENL